jgi:NADH-quinone oxidoreductase subunit N
VSAVNYVELLWLAAPETILILTVLVLLAADPLALRGLDARFRRLVSAMIASVGCVVAIGWMVALPQQASLQQGVLVVDSLTQLIKVALLALTMFTVLISVETEFTSHAGEYFGMILLAAIGMMFLVSTEDVLMIFISLELTSLSLYVLTAFNKRDPKSAEAALKYFLFGGMSAAFTLFGLSLLYGLSGSTNLGRIAATITSQKLDPLLVGALVMTVIGLGFKVAAVPFHLWAPDAYQGAPAPSAAFIASGSKVAGFFVLARVMMHGFKGAEGSGAWLNYQQGWVPLLAMIAGASMLLGNLTAIVQSSVRRLLAYSAIAHAGYMLLGILPHGQRGATALIYYVITYGLATLGAFGVVSVVERRSGGDRLSDFAGLSRRAPVLSLCMTVFMLSLAGIPPLAGFFGKFYLFASTLSDGASNWGLLWLVVAALALSAVSLYYYLKVLKQIYIAEPGSLAQTMPAPVLGQMVIALLALGVLVLGCAPELLIGRLTSAIRASGF